MKKILSTLLIVCFCALLFVACDNNANAPTDNTGNTDDPQNESIITSDLEEDKNWETFLAEYEAFVDDYIELTNKYKANPTDLTIVNQYTEMSQKVAEWNQEIDEIKNELANDPTAAAEFADKLADIVKKLEKAQ
ncbi:MAG: hypothetical protein IJC55_04560 [Clostridia bacterium]|nr:hypothetical protein [Clostridia bacterium]